MKRSGFDWRHMTFPVLLLTARLAAAQSPPPAPASAPAVASVPSMTLDQALAFARAHQPAVLVARARLQAQQVAARVPRAQRLPRVGGTAQLLGATANNTTSTYLGTPYTDLPRIGATRTLATGSWRPYASTLLGVSVDQQVYDFGRIATLEAVEDTLTELERNRVDAERLRIDLGVRETFYAVHAARGVLAASEQAYERSKVHRDLAAAAVKAGLRSPIELTRAEADLTRFDVARARAMGALQDARSAFAAAVGVSDLELDVAGPQPPEPTQPSLEEALASASRRDPAILIALARVRAQEAVTKSLAAKLRPDLRLMGAFSGREGGAPPSSGDMARFDGWVPDVPNWSMGLVLSWPIYDGVLIAQRNAARAVEAVRRSELDLARQEEVVAVQRAEVALTVARTALVGLQRAEEAAIANWRQADARFTAGLGTSVELADAEAVRTDAEIQLALGRFEVLRARATLGRLMGED
jgi:outer membrane protein TolC